MFCCIFFFQYHILGLPPHIFSVAIQFVYNIKHSMFELSFTNQSLWNTIEHGLHTPLRKCTIMLRSNFSCLCQSTLVIFPSPYPNLFVAPTFMAAAARACAVSLLASQHNIAIVLVSMSARGMGVKGHMIMISFQTFNSINGP